MHHPKKPVTPPKPRNVHDGRANVPFGPDRRRGCRKVVNFGRYAAAKSPQSTQLTPCLARADGDHGGLDGGAGPLKISLGQRQ